MSHTKGEWKVNGTIVQDETGYPIVLVWPNTKLSSADSSALMNANAHRICQCVNNFDRLLEACRMARHNEHKHWDEIKAVLDSAIAAAEG